MANITREHWIDITSRQYGILFGLYRTLNTEKMQLIDLRRRVKGNAEVEPEVEKMLLQVARAFRYIANAMIIAGALQNKGDFK